LLASTLIAVTHIITGSLVIDLTDYLQLADHFCNAVGVLQQSAPPGHFVGFEKTASKPPAVTNEGDF